MIAERAEHKPTIHTAALVWPTVALLLGIAADCGAVPAEAAADDYGPDVVAVGRLVVNEASFSAGDDATAIALVVKRHAERLGVSPAAYVERTHRRIGSSRPWVAELGGSLEKPASWPEDAIPWEPIGRTKWAGVLARVSEALEGRSAMRCDAVTWGGPVVDAERIARMLSAGWERAPCGWTRNVFLRRSGRR